jgi:CheY-like chemotaxis protein
MPTILVVDDDENQRLLYRQELELSGYQVETAANGPQAIDRVGKGGIDVVLLDIAMPGMDGIEVLGRLLDIDRQLPVILNTAYSSYKEDFMTWAAESYVTKSGDLRELRTKIRDALVKRGLESPDDLDEGPGEQA